MGAGGARRRLLAGLACVAGLAGCSAAGPDPAAGATPVDELEAYVEAVFAGLDMEAQARLEQDAIAVCMSDLGFEYIPTLAGQTSQKVTEGDPAEMEAFRLTEGWGVTAESTGTGMERPGTTETVVHDEEDPNGEVLDALSETARTAWATAQRDCQGQAWERSSAEGTLAAHPDLAALHSEIMELRDDESDPQWQNLNARWAQCMTDRGYPGYTAPSLARFDFFRAHGEVPPLMTDEIEEQRTLEVATAFLAEHKAEMDEMLVILQEALPRLSDDAATH